MTTPHLRKSINRSLLRRGFFLIPLVLVCLGLSPAARAVLPAPDGGYPNNTTAEGEDALFSLTTGTNNTALGFNALFSDTTGEHNTANGSQALYSNTTGHNNTANGWQALFSNTSGGANTANGVDALYSNTTGSGNTANGVNALYSNTTGNSNIALGVSAGFNLTTGNNNIDIGNFGVAAEANTIRLGTTGTHTNTYIAGIYQAITAKGVSVIVDSTGHLGTAKSSARFKEAIKPMEKTSEAILALTPVTFRYKHELDPDGIPQFGLVAEEVAKVNPDLVALDEEGKPYTVRYEAVNAMLLNEFLKEHRKVEEQETIIGELKATTAKQTAMLARQEKAIVTLTSQVQKVSARVETQQAASRLASE